MSSKVGILMFIKKIITKIFALDGLRNSTICFGFCYGWLIWVLLPQEFFTKTFFFFFWYIYLYTVLSNHEFVSITYNKKREVQNEPLFFRLLYVSVCFAVKYFSLQNVFRWKWFQGKWFFFRVWLDFEKCSEKYFTVLCER